MIIDGRAVAARIRAELFTRTALFFEKTGRKPAIAVVLIGSDPASEIYVRNKLKGCDETGIRSVDVRLPETVSAKEAASALRELASRDDIDGILLQLPIPARLDARLLLREIPAEKDVDGFSTQNLGALARGEEGFVACTPLGVMELLKRYNIPTRGKHAVVVGRSNIVGKPMSLLLLNADATVTVCHSRTADLKEECLRADILVTAVGKAGLITADMVKEGATVIDVGMNRGKDGKLCGDVDFENVQKKAAFITPVPGGVGPMTVAMLLSNVCTAAEKRLK